MKIIKINSCKECPNLRLMLDENEMLYNSYVCIIQVKEKHKITIKDINSIPEWCSLENYP